MADPTGGTGSIWAEPLVWILGAVTTMATTLAGRVVYNADRKETEMTSEIKSLNERMLSHERNVADNYPKTTVMYAALDDKFDRVNEKLDLMQQLTLEKLSTLVTEVQIIRHREMQRRKGDTDG